MARTEAWRKLGSGIEVYGDLLRTEDDAPFTLACPPGEAAARINQLAERYGAAHLRAGLNEDSFTAMNKLAALLALAYEDDRRLPSRQEYVDIALDVAAGVRGKSVPEIYGMLHEDPGLWWSATGDVIVFRECFPDSFNPKRYRVEIRRFSPKDGTFQPVAEGVEIAAQGWIKTLGLHGYPTETSEHRPDLLEKQDTGYFMVGDPSGMPKTGDERIVICGPCRPDEWLLGLDLRKKGSKTNAVGGLIVRGERLEKRP